MHVRPCTDLPWASKRLENARIDLQIGIRTFSSPLKVSVQLIGCFCFVFFPKNDEKIKISRIKLEKMFIIAEFCAESFANIFRFLKALYPARSTFFVNKKTKITTFLLKNIHKLILLLKFLQIIFQHWQLIPIPVYEEHNRPVRKRFLDTIKNNISQPQDIRCHQSIRREILAG